MVQKLQFFPQTWLSSFLIYLFFPIANRQSPIAYRLSPFAISFPRILLSNCICHLLLPFCQSSSPSAISHRHRHRHRHRPFFFMFSIHQNLIDQYHHSKSSISWSFDQIYLKIGGKVAYTPHYEAQIVALLESLRF